MECTKIENVEHSSTTIIVNIESRRNNNNGMQRSSLGKRVVSSEMPQIQWSESMMRSCVKKQTLTLYFRKMAMGMAVINYPCMETLFFKNSDTFVEEQELQQDEYSLALFYAIQALCDQ